MLTQDLVTAIWMTVVLGPVCHNISSHLSINGSNSWWTNCVQCALSLFDLTWALSFLQAENLRNFSFLGVDLLELNKQVQESYNNFCSPIMPKKGAKRNVYYGIWRFSLTLIHINAVAVWPLRVGNVRCAQWKVTSNVIFTYYGMYGALV